MRWLRSGVLVVPEGREGKRREGQAGSQCPDSDSPFCSSPLTTHPGQLTTDSGRLISAHVIPHPLSDTLSLSLTPLLSLSLCLAVSLSVPFSPSALISLSFCYSFCLYLMFSSLHLFPDVFFCLCCFHSLFLFQSYLQIYLLNQSLYDPLQYSLSVSDPYLYIHYGHPWTFTVIPRNNYKKEIKNHRYSTASHNTPPNSLKKTDLNPKCVSDAVLYNKKCMMICKKCLNHE